jgi:hypothetical protein
MQFTTMPSYELGQRYSLDRTEELHVGYVDRVMRQQRNKWL